MTSHFVCAFNIPDLPQGEPGLNLKTWLEEREKAGTTGIIYSNENIELLQLSCSDASLPGSSLITNQIDNDYSGVTERHAYRRQYDDRADFTFYVDRNYTIIKFFEGWISYIIDEQTSAISRNYNYRVRFPDAYQTDNLYITKFERDVNTSNPGPSLTYKFIRAYPISINSMPVSYDASDLLKCTVSFTYSRYIVNRTNNLKINERSNQIPTNYYGPAFQNNEEANRQAAILRGEDVR